MNRAAIYARVSTLDQTADNQLLELRRYVAARGWSAVEYVDRGVSGAKDRRPALDQMLADAKRRRFDVLICWRLDRLGRNLRHLILLLDELTAVGIGFVTLGEGIDNNKSERPAGPACAGRHRRIRAGTAPRTGAGRPPASQDARTTARKAQGQGAR